MPAAGSRSSSSGEVGQEAAGREGVEIANGLQVEPLPVALIGDGCVGVAVGDDDGAAGQGGPDHLGHVLLAGGQEEEGLGERGGPGLELEQGPDGLPERGAVRLAGFHHLEAPGAQMGGEAAALGGLAGALHSLDGDESAAHGDTLTH